MENVRNHRDIKLEKRIKRIVSEPNFWWFNDNRNEKNKSKNDIQILIALLFTLKSNIFLKIFLMMLRNGLIHLRPGAFFQ